MDRKALTLCFSVIEATFLFYDKIMVNSSFTCVCCVVTVQSAETQIGRIGSEITGFCSSLFSSPNLQNRILYEEQIKCHTGSCTFITFKTRAIIRGNIKNVVENASLYNARKNIYLDIYRF